MYKTTVNVCDSKKRKKKRVHKDGKARRKGLAREIAFVPSIVPPGLSSVQEWPPLELTVSHKSYEAGDRGADEAKLCVRGHGKMAARRAHVCSCVRERGDRDSSLEAEPRRLRHGVQQVTSRNLARCSQNAIAFGIFKRV